MSEATTVTDENIQQHVKNELSATDALDLISSYLPNEWTSVDDIKVSRIIGGYMNTVYLVERTSETINEPNQVILRKKGGGIIIVEQTKDKADVFASEVEEVVVALAAARATVGPQVYGFFTGGRIEEYVVSHTLTPQDVLESRIYVDIAKAYARFHCIDIPYRRKSFHKVQTLIQNGIGQFQENINYIIDPFIPVFADAPGPIEWDVIKSFDFTTEYLWVCKVLDQVAYRMVIVAGDPNYLNVLVRSGDVPPGKLKVVLVDYELAQLQPRGIELGGHFANRMFCWNARADKASGYEILNDEERKKFIDEYTHEFNRLNKLPKVDASDLDSSAHIMEEADIGILYYLLQFSFFISSNLGHFTGDKSLPTGAVHQLKKYMQIKPLLTKKYPHWQ